MSYNLLLDTNFTKSNKHWKLTNCIYKNGYLLASSNVYSIEQTITLPDPTKLYFSMDYIAFDRDDIEKVYIGIQQGDLLETTIKKPKSKKRNKISVVYPVMQETITVKFIVEAKSNNSKIYIDSPILVDLCEQNKTFWAKWMLDKIIDYRYGFDYENLYKQCEITLDNKDFTSTVTTTEKADCGILAYVEEKDWFDISFNMEQNKYYLIKLDIEQVNDFGEVYIQCGEVISEQVNKDQLYIAFKADGNNKPKIKMKNNEKLPYVINFKHILVVDITDKNFEEADIPHLAFV